MISSVAVEKLSPRELALMIWREEMFFDPTRGIKALALCLTFYLSGILLGLMSSAVLSLQGWAAWFWLVAFISTWSFLALFVFPFATRRDHADADRMMIRHGIPAFEYAALLKKIQQCNQTETQVPAWVESIFHPVPTLSSRLKKLEKASS
ncbi:MAG: hypothetical protein HC904_15525 [Blastochloris sp.]|nr:hypothetical protein [Blastochloris sp.]